MHFPCSKRHGTQFQNKMQVLEEISREEEKKIFNSVMASQV
jgi:hypothetical protein